jgi:uncharacterized membrane-anchored protein
MRRAWETRWASGLCVAMAAIVAMILLGFPSGFPGGVGYPATAWASGPEEPEGPGDPEAPAPEEPGGPGGPEDSAAFAAGAPGREAGEATLPEGLTVGPAIVELGHNVAIALPEGFVLGDREYAREVAVKQGDDPADVIGMIVPLEGGLWALWIHFEGVGYVSDADAGDLDPANLLELLRQGDARQNEIRRAKGLSTLTVDGWSTPPSYQRDGHTLRWGLRLTSSDGDTFGNDVVKRLGRRGMVNLVLVASADQREAALAAAAPVIAAVSFLDGHRYEDFDPATDAHSGMSLTNLIVGGGAVATASKLGLFGKLLVAGKKLILVIALAIAGLWRWLLARVGRGGRSERRDPGVG